MTQPTPNAVPDGAGGAPRRNPESLNIADIKDVGLHVVDMASGHIMSKVGVHTSHLVSLTLRSLLTHGRST